MEQRKINVYTHAYGSAVGEILIASDGSSITGLWFAGQAHFPDALIRGDARLPVFAAADRWLNAYFAGGDPGETPPLSPRGTDFQMLVWDILRTIPRGGMATYGEIARKAAVITGRTRMSAQAVGGAVGRNPISIMIPCHRVIGEDGSLTGYAGGIEKKRFLLTLEGAIR